MAFTKTDVPDFIRGECDWCDKSGTNYRHDLPDDDYVFLCMTCMAERVDRDVEREEKVRQKAVRTAKKGVEHGGKV